MAEDIWTMKKSLARMTAEQRELIGALVGLARVCDTNEPTENTNRVMVEALMALKDTEEARRTAEALTLKVREEKLTISPGCRYCASPCGRTADFELAELNLYPESSVELKGTLIDVIADNIDTIKFALLPDKDSYSFFLALRYAFFVLGEDYTDGGIYDAIQKLKSAVDDLRRQLTPFLNKA